MLQNELSSIRSDIKENETNATTRHTDMMTKIMSMKEESRNIVQEQRANINEIANFIQKMQHDQGKKEERAKKTQLTDKTGPASLKPQSQC